MYLGFRRFDARKPAPFLGVTQNCASKVSKSGFAHNTRAQLKQIFETIRQLMTPPDPPKRPIGFITPQEEQDRKK
ncbi:hypothetical protein AGMMS50256_26640 [Betaproteobacteria bacterium]|nr:hypothetical protein AGMMS50256_26640 [Betaproteobacteria bacterium]